MRRKWTFIVALLLGVGVLATGCVALESKTTGKQKPLIDKKEVNRQYREGTEKISKGWNKLKKKSPVIVKDED